LAVSSGVGLERRVGHRLACFLPFFGECTEFLVKISVGKLLKNMRFGYFVGVYEVWFIKTIPVHITNCTFAYNQANNPSNGQRGTIYSANKFSIIRVESALSPFGFFAFQQRDNRLALHNAACVCQDSLDLTTKCNLFCKR